MKQNTELINTSEGKSDINFGEIFWEKFSPNSTSRSIVEPPQIEGSTVDDWLQFFIQNAFIFVVWLLAMVWVCYVTFYHARLVGFIITKIVNYLLIKNGYFKIGSFSFASISGKMMFRDLVYVTEDYSIRVKDGWIVFSYWIPYLYRDARIEDLSNSDVRLMIYLDGLELHIYNRSKHYSELEKLFNLPSRIFADSENNKEYDDKLKGEKERRDKIIKTMNESAAVNELKQSIWRDLIAMTKIEISSGRFVFGNHLIPSTLSISFEESHFYYTSQPAASPHDLFTHIVKGKAENLKVHLVPSPKYNDFLNDEPPRFMGDGFIVFKTNKIELYYYQDEPGLVLDETTNESDTLPAWGMVVKCGKGTDFTYGPWADRQRADLYSFFYPSDYQIVPISEKPRIGERRRFESFDIRLSTLYDAKIDIIFQKNKETHVLHINASPGSYLEATIPWIYNETGYTSHILGQILHLDATTSLDYRPLISSETLEFDVKISFPRIWNEHQEWVCKITACKATVDLIFAHKFFIQDLIDDWSDKNRPDILKFIPYTWRISIVIKDFELLILANEYNWLDCSTGLHDENCKIAVCGEHFDMAFDLPFFEFLPPKLAIKIWIQGECLEGAFYLPSCSLNCDIIELIQQYSKLKNRDSSQVGYFQQFGQSRKWKNVVSRENHWFECMTAPIVALSITYDFWPMPVINTHVKDSEVTTPELEEMLLMPLRPENSLSVSHETSQKFDPNTMPPDVMTVELEIGPMNLALFGILFRFLWNIKENYLGEYQKFSDMSVNFFDDIFELKKRNETTSSEKKEKTSNLELDTANSNSSIDPRYYRPFEVIVSTTLHEIQGHLVQCYNESELYSPLVYIEKLCFELQKNYQETKLQLLISPAVLQVQDGVERKEALSSTLKEGFLSLSSLQFRGHAMFSNLDRPIESETLEYAWLVDIEVGEIGGRLTLDQLKQILIPLETFFFQILQADIELQPPNPYKKCLHDQLQNDCIHSDLLTNKLCPYSEDLKYRMVRVNLNKIDVFFVESNIILNVVVPSVRLATCNLHIKNHIDGFTLLLTNCLLRQFVALDRSERCSQKASNNWAEISHISTGPIFIDTAMSSLSVDNYSISQVDFIRKHDTQTKRLWFLWNDLNSKCGCVGNCSFFGCNLEGLDFFNIKCLFDNVFPASIEKKLVKCYGKLLHNHDSVTNFNYGESLLHPGNYLLDITSPLMDETSRAVHSTYKLTKDKPADDKINAFDSQSTKRLKTNHSSSTSTVSKSNDTLRPSASSSERFFSAEDLSRDTLSSLDNLKRPSSCGKGTNTISSSYQTPSEMISIEDITSISRYYTAQDDTLVLPSPNADSSATLQKCLSLSSDSLTLVSADNSGTKSKDDEESTMSEKTCNDHTSFNSFMSAMSDHGELDLVDLRNQLEKPIVDSPLLMSAYVNYLSIYTSEFLDVPPPFPLLQNEKILKYFRLKSSQAIHFERLLIDYRTKWKTQFKLKNVGFSDTKLISKCDDSSDELKFYETNFIPGIVATRGVVQRAKDCHFLTDNEVVFSPPKPSVSFLEISSRSRAGTNLTRDDEKEGKVPDVMLDSSLISSTLVHDNENALDKLVVYVQLREVQVKLSPLSLDVMSGFLESLTQIFSRIHPVTYFNHLNFALQNKVETKNNLKKEKLLYLGQLHMKAWKLVKDRQKVKHLNRSISFSDKATKTHELGHSSNTLVSNNLEVDQKLSLNINVSINRVAMSSIQASIVEEIIPFSALDHVKDLTCVTLFNIVLDHISLDVNRTFRKRRILHILIDQSSVSNLSFTERALMTRLFTRKPKKIYSEIETNAWETTDAFVDDVQSSISLRSIQLQLSRLINSAEVLRDSNFTVIPFKKTKVGFIFLHPMSNLHDLCLTKREGFSKGILKNSSSTSFRKNLLKRQNCVMEETSEVENAKSSDLNADSSNYNRVIMFETGLENISLVLVHSSSLNATRLNEPKPPLNDSNVESVVSPNACESPLSSSELRGKIDHLWLHFASPPKLLHNNYRDDLTRHDWHLLSSVVPMAIAWVSVFDRVAFHYGQFSNQARLRTSATMACIMTTSLHDYLQQKNTKIVKPLHNTSKQLIRIFSALAKSYQDDPSIHLITVMRAAFKNSFKTNDDFELYLRSSAMPKVEDMEKGIVSLLFQWKYVLNSILSQQSSSQSGKTTLSSTKNQILALLEEKTRQLNQAMTNIAYESGIKSTTINPTDYSQIKVDSESVTLNLNDTDNETARLLSLRKQPGEISTRDELELHEISSNITRQTASDVDPKRYQTTRHKYPQNRVHFMSRSHVKIVYDRFLALPVVRNISTLCYSSFSGVSSSLRKICQPNTMVSGPEVQERQQLDASLRMESLNSLKLSDAEFELHSNSKGKASGDVTRNNEVRLAIPDYDPYDSTHLNGRYSSYSNYGDKKDLYWWMVKQQDYMKNVTNNLASSLKDCSRPVSKAQYYNLNHQDSLTLEMIENELGSNADLDKPRTELESERDEIPKETISENNVKRNKEYFIKQNLDYEVAHFFDSIIRIFHLPSIQNLDTVSHGNFGGLGSKIALSLTLKQFYIDVDEAEQELENNVLTASKLHLLRRAVSSPSDYVSAFVCDHLSLKATLFKRLSNYTSDYVSATCKEFDPHLAKWAPTVSLVLQDIEKRSNYEENVLSSDAINVITFDVQIGQAIQRINLPLLRLIHQFSAMYDNVTQMRFEMRSNRTEFFKREMDASQDLSFSSMTSFSSSSSTLSGNGEEGVSPKEDHCIIGIESDSSDKGLPQGDITKPNQESKGMTNQVERCWRTLYILMDQYQQNKLKVLCHPIEQLYSTEELYEKPNTNEFYVNVNEEAFYAVCTSYGFIKQPFIIVGGGLVKHINLVAMLSSLKLNGDLHNLSFTFSLGECYRKSRFKKELVPPSVTLRNMCNSTIDVKLEQTKIALYEEAVVFPMLEPSTSTSNIKQQLVVEMIIGQSSVNLGHKREFDYLIDLTVEQLGRLFSLPRDSRNPIESSTHLITNQANVSIGAIEIDIPQHPVALHGMMTRSGRQLSTTLQELRSSRQPSRLSRQTTMTHSATGITDSQMPSSPLQAPTSSLSSSGHLPSDQTPVPNMPTIVVHQADQSLNRNAPPLLHTRHQHLKTIAHSQGQSQQLIVPFLVEFSIILESLTIKTLLLPSLQAKYRIKQVKSSGSTGSKAKFTVDVNNHFLSFGTLVESSGIPSEASINLPRIHVSAEYLESSSSNPTVPFVEGVVLRKGNYLNMTAEIGAFEHCLTTDLLNHLLFVQKVFMKEINEVLQKMSRSENDGFMVGSTTRSENKLEELNLKPSSRAKTMLFFLNLRMAGIQITATTPTNNAVRLETGTIELQVSNRVMNVSRQDFNIKIFVRVQLDFNLALGQLIRNSLFEEVEPDFQQLAYFKTRINMRNAFQNEMLPFPPNDSEGEDEEDKEIVLITLNRPLVYIQPLALDKAVLVWINYKNSYEYWNEQRASLNKEVSKATQIVIDKIQPLSQSFSSSQSLGTLFLQLTVNDFGICLPISSTVIGTFPNQTRIFDADLKDALVLTLESTRISACSRGSLVSKAQFNNLCIRFADDFETMLDDWKPDLNDSSIKNLCIVTEGTYEICSRTITHQNLYNAEKMRELQSSNGSADAKWILNVSWKMDGFDIHVDTSIGKHITSLFKTMTVIAGDEDDDEDEDEEEEEADAIENVNQSLNTGASVDFSDEKSKQKTFNDNSKTCFNKRCFAVQELDDSKLEEETSKLRMFKKRSATMKDFKEINKKREIEKKFNEQAKIINDLKQLGASNQTIQQEMQRFQKLEAAVFNQFRRGVIKKLKRPSTKNGSNKSMLTLRDYKTRAYSTSSYSCEDSAKSLVTHPPLVGTSSTMSKARSSTIVVPLKEECGSLETLSSADENSSYTDHDDTEHVPQDGFSPDLEKQKEYQTDLGQTCSPSISILPSSTTDPKIDFELDVKIFFNSGKCVLHTKELVKNDDLSNSRNYSATDMTSQSNSSSMSPILNRNSNQKLSSINKSASASKLTRLHNTGVRREYQSAGMNPDFTVFLIPGLDIKLHYSSKSVNFQQEDDKEQQNFRNFGNTFERRNTKEASSSHSMFRGKMTKKASLFACITLCSIPEEIFISPHILDFFDEALRPIPITVANSANATMSSTQSEQAPFGASASSITSTSAINEDTPAQYAYYASFPVDVIVFFHFQPTVIRLGCLPVSRVECMLHLPSIDLVMSSKRSDFEFDLNSESVPLSMQQMSAKAFKNFGKSFSSDSQQSIFNSTGGLSITACLSDFFLYIFHPYGGQKNKSSVMGGSAASMYSASDRKDSLRLQVEFVKINISRSRKIFLGDSLTQSISFSAIFDIGTATFKYDVRRLNEILAFPKAWYRKSIWKKIFIGENTLNAIFSDEEENTDEHPNFIESIHLNDTQSDDLDLSSSSTSFSNELSLEESSSNEKIKNKSKIKKRKPKSHMIAIVNNPWETLVLLTVNFSKLNVTMNMGNIMGNVTWLTRNFVCDGSVSIDSSSNRNFRFGIYLQNSTLDAKGGIVGGIVELCDIRTELKIREDGNREPQHRVSCSLHTIETRVDYMGTSILMMRVSDLNASFYDEWRVMSTHLTTSGTVLKSESTSAPTLPKAFIFVHGFLNWDQLQVLMSKSTSPDFIKIISKLEEFFTQQFHSGKRVFDSLHPSSNSSATANLYDSLRSKNKRTQSVGSCHSNNTNPSQHDLVTGVELQISYHRHWQRALHFVTRVLCLSRDLPPKHAVILGGTIEVKAQNISLACFYGVNFRSKSWAVFSLRQPLLTFMTEAQSVESEEGSQTSSTHVVQNLSLILGRRQSASQDTADASSRTMATVSKISRNVVFPPQFRHLHEWFHYAFSPVEIDDVNRFPLSSPENPEFDAFGVPVESLTSTPLQTRHSNTDRKIKSTSEFHYKEEMIFAFPSMQLELKTEHLQGPSKPMPSDTKPLVECSFISDFDDHIYVAVDAEAYFFLHDLINSYINETHTGSESNKEHESKSGKGEKGSQEDSLKDFREFVCKVWLLEPTVRLHSWASKNIDPYGVDYILQRLGFNQARTTIPKWIQRSTMDGIDKMISLIVYWLILKNQEENPKSPRDIASKGNE